MEKVFFYRQHSKLQPASSELTATKVHCEEFSVCQKSKWPHRFCNNAQDGLGKFGYYAHELSER